MIETLRLENFKRHALTELRLSPLTVLVGPNGSGKTSALEALHLLSGLDRDDGPVLRPGFSMALAARRQPGVRHIALAVRGRSQGEERALSLRLQHNDHDVWNGAAELVGGVQVGARGFEPNFDLPRVGPQDYWPELHRAVLLRLDAREVAKVTEPSEEVQLRVDGSPLATVLANRKLADDPNMPRMLEALRGLVPEHRALRVLPAAITTPEGRRSGYRMEFDTLSGKELAAEDMSEGTLLLLALLSVLYSPVRPRLLLLDDVHEALHPRAQMELMKHLRALTSGPDPVQIIATTHSPYILDYVEPEAVLVFAQTTEGTSMVRALAQHPDHQRLRGQLSAGQLWTLDEEADWMMKVGP